MALVGVAGLGTLLSLVASRVEVHGPSMLPTLDEGERLLVRRARRVRPGDLAVLNDPEMPARLIVKRVVAVRGRQTDVAGDNPATSRDSRAFGPVDRSAIVGVAWYRYHPAAQAGRLRRSQPAELPA
jgi:nickel-type superoxide dismutase maturation protease